MHQDISHRIFSHHLSHDCFNEEWRYLILSIFLEGASLIFKNAVARLSESSQPTFN